MVDLMGSKLCEVRIVHTNVLLYTCPKSEDYNGNVDTVIVG